MIASVILMLLTLIAMFAGVIAPTMTIPMMIFWSAIGIMTEIRRTHPQFKEAENKVTHLPEEAPEENEPAG